MYVPGQQTTGLADYSHFCPSLGPGVTAFRSVELEGSAWKTKWPVRGWDEDGARENRHPVISKFLPSLFPVVLSSSLQRRKNGNCKLHFPLTGTNIFLSSMQPTVSLLLLLLLLLSQANATALLQLFRRKLPTRKMCAGS